MTEPSYPTLVAQKRFWDAKWDREKTKYPHEGALRRGEKILAFVRELRVVHPRILDSGCGTGWFTAQLAQIGEVVGVDLSDQAISLAKTRYPDVTFLAGDLFDMEFAAEHFDVVVSQEVIAHVSDQAAYLRLIAGVLKPRGYVVISTPNKFVQDRVGFPPQPAEHIEAWLTTKALKRLLSADLRVLKITTVNPMGAGGILRLINSHKLNRMLCLLMSAGKLRDLKERAGFGWTTVALAQKRA